MALLRTLLSSSSTTIRFLVGAQNEVLRTLSASSFVRHYSAEAVETSGVETDEGLSLHDLNERMTNSMNKGEYKNVFETYEELKNMGFSPDVITYNTLLQSYNHTRQFKQTLGMHEAMKEAGVPINVNAYNGILKACIPLKTVRKAKEIVEEMESTGVRPNVFTYNTLIELFSRVDDYFAAERQVAKMREEHINLSGTTYARMILAAGKTNKIKRAMAYLDEAQDSNHSFSMGLYSSLLNNTLEIQHADGLLRVFKEIRSKFPRVKFDEGTLLATLNVAAKKGNAELAHEAWTAVGNSGISPSEPMWNALLSTLGRAGILSAAFRTLAFMREKGIEPAENGIQRIVRACGRTTEEVDNAFFILENMKEKNEKVDITAINCVIEACANSRKVDSAFATFNDIKEKFELEPNVDSFNAVILACGLTNQPENVLELFERMKKDNVEPNKKTFTNVVSSMIRNEDPDGALKFIEENVPADGKAYSDTTGLVIRKLARIGKYDQAEEILNVLKERSVPSPVIAPLERYINDAKSGKLRTRFGRFNRRGRGGFRRNNFEDMQEEEELQEGEEQQQQQYQQSRPQQEQQRQQPEQQ